MHNYYCVAWSLSLNINGCLISVSCGRLHFSGASLKEEKRYGRPRSFYKDSDLEILVQRDQAFGAGSAHNFSATNSRGHTLPLFFPTTHDHILERESAKIQPFLYFLQIVFFCLITRSCDAEVLTLIVYKGQFHALLKPNQFQVSRS